MRFEFSLDRKNHNLHCFCTSSFSLDYNKNIQYSYCKLLFTKISEKRLEIKLKKKSYAYLSHFLLEHVILVVLIVLEPAFEQEMLVEQERALEQEQELDWCSATEEVLEVSLRPWLATGLWYLLWYLCYLCYLCYICVVFQPL